MRRTLPLLALAVGCGFLDAPGDPLLVAHRGGAASWPENSRAAVAGALEAGVEGLEVDLFLTGDRVPVLVHDAWLPESHCRTVDGGALSERVYLLEYTLEELDAGWVCGAAPDPEFPDAAVIPDTLMTLDELLDALEDHPSVTVQLDVKYWPGISHDPEVFAAEILERWWAADLPNPMFLSGFSPEQSVAFQERAARKGHTVETWLTWPYFPLESSEVLTALGHEFSAAMGFSDMVAAADAAQATGFDLPWQLMDRRLVEDAHAAGYGVSVWTVNDARLLRQMEKWPVDVIISDHIGGPQ